MTAEELKDIHEVLLRIEKKIDKILAGEHVRRKIVEAKPKGSRKNHEHNC